MSRRDRTIEQRVRRGAVVMILGHMAFIAVMVAAALGQDDGLPFWFLVACGVLGAGAAALLASSVTAGGARQERITTATALIAISFAAAVAAAFLGGPAYLLAPVMLLFANGMLVGAARRLE